ncbi:MAG: GNAT family N-acetyltransferase [Hyphomicrobiales bacterium]|nr:MAG: GNAT family N-acetyltransferase [Hyphomicrobiales bacterium]
MGELPTFETERLLLRPRTMDDFDACLAMDRDPLVTRYVAGPWSDRAAHEQFVRARMASDYDSGLGYWSIFAKVDPATFLGWVLLIPVDAVGPEIEIGWRLVRSAWGKGYASEAARPVVAHAFETLKLDIIIADIHPDNTASMRVAEKAGLVFRRDGTYGGVPCRCYSMTAADHDAVKHLYR